MAKSNRYGHRFRGSGLAAAALALAAGCGGSGSADSPKKASAASDIVIGTLGTYSGPAASSLGPGLKTLQAWVDDTNAGGGIAGRHVRLVVKDDAGNAATALLMAKQLATQDKVVAIVNDASLFDTTWASYIEKSGVAVVGGEPQDIPFATNADFFTTGTNYVAQSFGKLQQAQAQGKSVGSLFCAEAPVCAAISAVYANFAPGLSLAIPVAQKTLATAPNYTAQCVALRDAGVGSYINDNGTDTALSIVNQCYDLGVKAKPIGSAGVITATWLKHPGAQGARDVELAFPFFDASTPASRAYQDMLKRHSLGDGGGAAGTYGYLSGKLFEAAIKASNGSSVTAASVKNGLYALKAETLGGLIAPVTYQPGKPTLVNCWFVASIENQKFTTPQGLKPSCAPDAVVEATLAKTSK